MELHNQYTKPITHVVNQEKQIYYQQGTGKYSTFILNTAKIFNAIAVPVFALLAISSIPRVSAGPIAYSVCLSGCEVAFTQAGLAGLIPSGGWSVVALLASGPACALLCGPALAAPSP